MNKLQRTYWTLRALGWENVPRRLWQTVAVKAGMRRRALPSGVLSHADLASQFAGDYDPERIDSYWKNRAGRFFAGEAFNEHWREKLRSLVPDEQWQQATGREAEQLLAGHMRYFAHRPIEVGSPPNFNRDPSNGVEWPTGRHWSSYVQFDPQLDDIKCVWEASRFGWAFTLARQFVRTGDAAYRTLFFDWFAAWDEQNPYGSTVNWACGQESTFRFMAWLFAAVTMMPCDGDSATARHYKRLTELIWYTARHIEGNINYARSQKNNHAISEAVGLMSVGLLFPEFRRSNHWYRKGLDVLAAEAKRQIYDDGSYVQHSINYHRLMLDDFCWAAALARRQGLSLPDIIIDKAARATEWLQTAVDPNSGRVPNYGSNDGALILALSTCNDRDYRPTMQSASWFFLGKPALPAGPWDEQAFWLAGGDWPDDAWEGTPDTGTSNVDRRPPHVANHAGGYYWLNGPNSRLMTRCHSYRDRPFQADMLHVDLWHGAANVLADAGNFSYYTHETVGDADRGSSMPWHLWFLSTAAHNTVEVDRQSQMVKGPRFLWFRWIRSKFLACRSSDLGRVGWFAGEHYGYRLLKDPVTHRRSILRVDDGYMIIDDLLGQRAHEAVLRWRLGAGEWQLENSVARSIINDQPYELRIDGSDACKTRLAEGWESPRPEGWVSWRYADKSPCPTLVATTEGNLPLRFVTRVGPADSWMMQTPLHETKPWPAQTQLEADFEPAITGAIGEITEREVHTQRPEERP